MKEIDFNFQKYKDNLTGTESGGNYEIENSLGALGRYQFMPYTLDNLQEKFNLPEWKPKENFLSDHSLQDLYFEKLVSDNLNILKLSGAENWIGTTVCGSLNPKYKDICFQANWYGLSAGAHLAGVGNVKKYFTNGHNPDDGYTSLSDYIAYHSKKGVE